jgi:hypothetical protein
MRKKIETDKDRAGHLVLLLTAGWIAGYFVQKHRTARASMDDSTSIQLQCVIDELKEMRMRMERTERRVQMLTDSFVVSGLWRTSSSLAGWKSVASDAGDEDMPLQFDMTND